MLRQRTTSPAAAFCTLCNLDIRQFGRSYGTKLFLTEYAVCKKTDYKRYLVE